MFVIMILSAFSHVFEMLMPYSCAFLRISGFMRMVVIFFFCFTVYHFISEIFFRMFRRPMIIDAMPIMASGKENSS